MVKVTPISAQAGVEVIGCTGDELLGNEAVEECRRLLALHGVVVYRGLHIADDSLIALGRRLGTLVVQPTGEHERPEIQVITMDPAFANKHFIAYRRGNFFWHFDGAMDELPQKTTFLSAQVVDQSGEGDTEFANTTAAFADLAADDRAHLLTLHVEHSFATAQGRANPDATDNEREIWSRRPPKVHPLIGTTAGGRNSILLGSTASHVVGWSVEDSNALFDRLIAWTSQPQYVVRHSWQVGDLVIWDNMAMLHRAMPFEPTSLRRLHRITLVGEPLAA